MGEAWPGSKVICMHVCGECTSNDCCTTHCVDLREEVSQTKAMLQAKSRELQVLQHYKVRLNMQIMQQILWLCPSL